MKNNLKHRTLLERGGLMIEALAMLGLIAVVTPTMYKKSAERTCIFICHRKFLQFLLVCVPFFHREQK